MQSLGSFNPALKDRYRGRGRNPRNAMELYGGAQAQQSRNILPHVTNRVRSMPSARLSRQSQPRRRLRVPTRLG